MTTEDALKPLRRQALPRRTRWCRDDWNMHQTCAQFKADATPCSCDCHKQVREEQA